MEKINACAAATSRPRAFYMTIFDIIHRRPLSSSLSSYTAARAGSACAMLSGNPDCDDKRDLRPALNDEEANETEPVRLRSLHGQLSQ